MTKTETETRDFETLLAERDLSLFAAIESQTTDDDKKSLLTYQAVVRAPEGRYSYLEIGSYLGGTIQPHLRDRRCERIYSIDKRPDVQPDERGVPYHYRNNSTARMLELLREVEEDGVEKIFTKDGDASEIPPETIENPVDLCLIDGEHTDEAAFSDFLFCLKVLKRQGVILFHDAPVVYRGIGTAVRHLEQQGIAFQAYALPSTIFAIEIGDAGLSRDPRIVELLLQGDKSYLFSMEANHYYRHFANKAPFKLYRKIVAKWKGLNRFD